MVGWILAIMGKGAIIAFNVWVTILVLKDTEVTQVPVFCVMVAVIAYFISTLFLTLFELSGITILHCFILDEETGGSAKTPESL
jgi:hypothetical protein